MKPSEIREGFYYSKKGDPNWLRYVVNIDKRVVLYVEWLGYQACRIETIAKFAAQRLTPREAAEQHPEEFAKIAKVLEQDPSFAVEEFVACLGTATEGH